MVPYGKNGDFIRDVREIRVWCGRTFTANVVKGMLLLQQANSTWTGLNRSHHCTILNNHKLLSWEDVIKYKNICLVFKILHNTAPPPLKSFIIQRNSSNQITRSATRGDLLIPFRKSTFGQQSFSVRAIRNWNSLPTTINDIHYAYIFHLYSTP